MKQELNEKQWRHFLALEALQIGRGGIQVSDEEMDQLNIQRDEFHLEWNYTIRPQPE